MRLASSISSFFVSRGISPASLRYRRSGIVGHGLDGEVERRLGGLQDTLRDRALLVDLDRLVEELGVQVLDLFHGHVEFLDQRHDFVAGDVPALLTDLEEILDVHDTCGCRSWLFHCLDALSSAILL